MSDDARELSVRMQGKDVAELQRLLLDLGYELPETELEPRHFGAATRRAVEDVLHRHRIDVTGVVDPVTAEVIGEAAGDVGPGRPVARLVDAESGLPLEGVSVRIQLPGADGHEVETSDPDGVVALHGAGAGAGDEPAVEGPVVLEVMGPEGDPVRRVELTIDRGQSTVPEVSVAPSRPAEQPIEAYAGTVGLDLPGNLLTRLRKRGIRSLDDIRSAGGLDGFAPESTLELLDAHASLSILPTDPGVNASLIDAGYRSIVDIAKAPREEFVDSMSTDIGADAAASVHDAADAQRAFLINVGTAARVGGTAVASASSAIEAATGQACACEDCSSALSPLAYLADLLDYSIDHLRKTRGLRGSFFGQTNFTDLRLTRTDPELDFDWGEGSPDPLVSPDRFAARWTGQLEPRFSQTYTFEAITDGGIRVWVGDQMVIDDWQERGPSTSTGTRGLTAGRRYDLKVEYFDTAGDAAARLLWSSLSQAREVIPQERLWPESGGLEVTLSLLEQLFHQPFSRFPAACRLVDERVRQVRICIEVLRAHLAANPPGPAGANYVQIAERDYLTSSYLKLLEEIGTSHDELSRARAAPTRERIALAERLGIDLDPLRGPGNPDELDQLVLEGADPSTVAEDTLEYLFGLRDTNRDPLDETPDGAILRWRQAHLRRVWEQEDWPANPPSGARPLIDPDLVGPDDFTSLASTAFSLWQQRQAWLRSRLDDKYSVYTTNGLETVFTGPPMPGRAIEDAQKGVVWLGIDFAEIETIRADLEAHKDVSGRLAALRLTEATFGQIARLVELFNTGTTFLEPELSNVFSILVELEKEEMFDDWRTEERQAGITLSPDYFRVPLAGGRGGRQEVELNPWRASRADRRRWELTLRARTEQDQTVTDGVQEAVDEAETARLGLSRLRDGLVLAVAPAAGDLEARADWITRRFQIDARAGVCQMTTRVAQAIETLQGVLFAARNGLLEDNYLGLDAPAFDEEWRWIGSYASWRAAMLVFLYPETMLRPTLRRRRSKAFDAVVSALRDGGRATGELAQEQAAEYSAYFADVCSLSFAGLARVSAPAAAGTEDEPMYLLLARGNASGRLYYCTQDERPDWWRQGGFSRGLWNAVPKLDATADVAHFFPYRGSDGRIHSGLYFRSGTAGARTLSFTSFNGSSWSAPAGTGAPVLVCSARLDPGSVPAGPVLAAAGTAGWKLQASDRMALLDVDGDGRKELVLMAGVPGSDGTRAVGFVRERSGALVLDRLGSIPGQWDLPAVSKTTVLRTALTQSPANYREQLLVIDTAGKNLGLLGMRTTDGQPAVIAATTNGTVAGPAAPTPWSVNPGAAFVSADLDGDGLTELVALERPVPGNPYLSLQVFTVRETGFTFRLSYGVAAVMPTWIVPVRDSQRNVGDALVRFGSRQGLASQGRMDADVISWNAATNNFRFGMGAYNAPLRADAPTLDNDDPSLSAGGWEFNKDDQVLAFEWDRGAHGHELLLTSAARLETAVVSIGANPPISFPQPASRQFEMVWRSAKRMEASADGEGQFWTRQLGDRFIAADLDGDGEQELAVVSADNQRVAVLARTAEGKLEVAWSEAGLVSGPGGASNPGWPLAAGSTYLAGDIDGDGCEEILVRAGDRLGVLRSGPPKRRAFDLGVRDSYGPSGVTARDVVTPTSELWTADRPGAIRNAYESNRGVSGLWVDDPDVPYLDEAYYFVPLELAVRLSEAGDYRAALDWFRSAYDYGLPVADRKTAYNLRIEEDASFAFARAADWLTDPLNPHLIAATRAGSYTRFTILAIVRCLLDFADAEFTRASAESIPRARALYLAALELLEAPELRLRDTRCQDLVEGVEIEIGSGEWQELWDEIRNDLFRISDYDLLSDTVSTVAAASGSNGDIAERVAEARSAVDDALERSSEAKTFEALLDSQAADEGSVATALLAELDVASAALRIRKNTARTGRFTPAPKFQFCVPPDPFVDAARRHAELSLLKIRSCRNIAGLQHRPEPYGEQTATQVAGDGVPSEEGLRPLPFRYGVLVERAKQLVDLARQIESSMLTAIEKGDEEAYRELRARQDLQLARAGVRLKDLQVAEANGGVQLASQQRNRAQLQQEHYSELLDGGLSAWETGGVAALTTAAVLEAAGLYSIKTFIEFAGAGAKVAAAQAQVFNTMASYERRTEEWYAQNRLAVQDVRLAEQQIRLARDQVSVATQDRAIAVLQADGAEAGLEFLTRKFTRTDLYEWMSGVLEGVYRFFLRQATSMAQLAQAQLAFERQDLIPTFIQADYWEPPESAAGESQDTDDDRRGLTGTARLLRDIYQLDQYAFETDQRKLQLSKTLSLAQIDPYAFQRFRETGVLVFETPLELFDRDFPGHLLRLVKRVRTSVVALVPPAEGIKATLSTTGTSRVVIRSPGFPKVAIQRGPESVALTSPVRATGLFDPDAQPEMLVPFEGIGVEAAWELKMPKAANRIDYSTIADVLLMIDYTALDNPDYRAERGGRLDRTISAERVFSFRHVLQDQWYDLHNPDQTAAPMEVTFGVSSADFPANLLNDITLAAVTVYYAPAAGVSTAGWGVDLRTQLTYLEDGATGTIDGTADPAGGLASTRLARGSDWIKFVGKLATGEWRLALPDTTDTRDLFDNDQVEDILFILTYTATTPPWPED